MQLLPNPPLLNNPPTPTPLQPLFSAQTTGTCSILTQFAPNYGSILRTQLQYSLSLSRSLSVEVE